MLLQIFLFMVSTVVADAEGRTGEALKFKKIVHSVSTRDTPFR